MNDSLPLADRITELEAKLALADDALDALNRTVFRQQQAIEQLERALRTLEAVVEGAGNGPPNPREEIPPHY